MSQPEDYYYSFTAGLAEPLSVQSYHRVCMCVGEPQEVFITLISWITVILT